MLIKSFFLSLYCLAVSIGPVPTVHAVPGLRVADDESVPISF